MTTPTPALDTASLKRVLPDCPFCKRPRGIGQCLRVPGMPMSDVRAFECADYGRRNNDPALERNVPLVWSPPGSLHRRYQDTAMELEWAVLDAKRDPAFLAAQAVFLEAKRVFAQAEVDARARVGLAEKANAHMQANEDFFDARKDGTER